MPRSFDLNRHKQILIKKNGREAKQSKRKEILYVQENKVDAFICATFQLKDKERQVIKDKFKVRSG